MQVELVWARARIAELEAALSHARSVRQTELSVPTTSSLLAISLREGGGFGEQWSGSPIPSGASGHVNKQQVAVVVDGLQQQRGILRELLREELRDIAKGRKSESVDVSSGKWSCPPQGGKRALNSRSEVLSGDRCSALVERKAVLEMGSAPPSLVVPHPPSHSPDPHPPSRFSEDEENQHKLHMLRPHDTDPGPSAAYWPGCGSAPESASQAEQLGPPQIRQFVAGCGRNSGSGAESSGMDGRFSDPEERSSLESPGYGASESTHGKAQVTQPRAVEEYMAVVLESAADGPNDLVRIVQRRNGGRLMRPSR
jgi:hypothetical protein